MRDGRVEGGEGRTLTFVTDIDPDFHTRAVAKGTDMIEKRRRLMTAWAEFCGRAPVEGNVIELPTAQRAMA